MAFKYFDRVKETSTTTGTGAITLGGAVSAFITFSSVYSNADTMYYCITDQVGTNWEVGIGTYNTGNTLSRTTVKASSNAGSAVNFTSGALYVFVDIPAAQFLNGTGGSTGSGALTFASGPNITLGNATGLVLTTGVSGVLPVANGGTNNASYAIGDLIYASNATALSRLAAVATGKALISQGVTTAPIWGLPIGVLVGVQAFSSSATYTPTANATKILIFLQGTGGGGGGTGTSGQTGGGTGGTTSLGSLASATGGVGGTASGTQINGGTGGVGSLGLLNLTGGGGMSSASIVNGTGGKGGEGLFGGGGAGLGGNTTATGINGANGGGGGGAASSGAFSGGAGGGAGGICIAYATGISGTYTVTIGAAGAAGGAGSAGSAGGLGGLGVILILEFA